MPNDTNITTTNTIPTTPVTTIPNMEIDNCNEPNCTEIYENNNNKKFDNLVNKIFAIILSLEIKIFF